MCSAFFGSVRVVFLGTSVDLANFIEWGAGGILVDKPVYPHVGGPPLNYLVQRVSSTKYEHLLYYLAGKIRKHQHFFGKNPVCESVRRFTRSPCLRYVLQTGQNKKTGNRKRYNKFETNSQQHYGYNLAVLGPVAACGVQTRRCV